MVATVLLPMSTTAVVVEAHLLVAIVLVAATVNAVVPLPVRSTMGAGVDTNLLPCEACEDLLRMSMDLVVLTVKIPTVVPRPATKTRMLPVTSVRRGLGALRGAMVVTMSLAAIGR